jgi:predicted nucleic acid-binding protein
MRIFLDANILVSVLNKEYPVFTYSSRVLSLADGKKFSLYTSPICLAIAFYFAEKKSGTQLAKKKIELLASKLLITNVGNNEVQLCLRNKKINDFEDGLEYYATVANKCSVIITEDSKDFYFADTEILSARSFMEKYLFQQQPA